jgi:hypothetical protein
MADLNDTFGERIILAARLAAAMHLDQVTQAQSDRGLQVKIGRADHHRAKDGQPPANGDSAPGFHRGTPFSAEGAAG